jgi:hypothetical protein
VVCKNEKQYNVGQLSSVISCCFTSMSSAAKVLKSGRKKEKVQDTEQVEIVDRRGRKRVVLRPVTVKKIQHATPPSDRKFTTRKPSSPIAGGSNAKFTKPSTKPKASKVSRPFTHNVPISITLL